MKRFLIICILINISCIGFAQDTAEQTKIAELENKVEQLEMKMAERDSLYESHLEKIQNERQDFVEFIKNNLGFIRWFLIIVSSIFVIFFFNEKKSIKKYKKEIEEEAKRELRTARDQAILEIASAINKDPMVIKSVMDERVKDAELKKKFSIRLFYSDESKMKSIKLQLEKFGIENIKEELVAPEDLTSQKFQKTQEKIVFIIDFNDKNGIETQLDKELRNFKKNRPCFFYAGKNKFPKNNQNITYNTCNSEITIYQNLMDLMRYMDFKGE
jgi:hypothetical protein